MVTFRCRCQVKVAPTRCQVLLLVYSWALVDLLTDAISEAAVATMSFSIWYPAIVVMNGFFGTVLFVRIFYYTHNSKFGRTNSDISKNSCCLRLIRLPWSCEQLGRDKEMSACDGCKARQSKVRLGTRLQGCQTRCDPPDLLRKSKINWQVSLV